MTNSHSLESVTAERFRGKQGTRFRMTSRSPEGSQRASSEVELVEVTEYPANALGTFRTPFSLLFHGPLDPVLPQGMYRLEQEQLGALELFIVPIGPNDPAAPGEAATAMRYEAVFG
jgi:hypothetical protein